MIKINKLNRIFTYRELFVNFNLEIPTNQLTFIVGDSNSGKSTLLKIIGGIEKADSGSITFYTESKIVDLFEKNNQHYTDYIFQNYNLLNDWNVYMNLQLSYNVKGKHFSEKLAIEMLNSFSLDKSLLQTKVSNLSVEEQQKIAIIRSLYRDSSIVVADEPAFNLDEKNTEEIFKIFKEISKHKTVIVVSNNIELVEKYADNVVYLDNGKLLDFKKLNNYNHEEKTSKFEYLDIEKSNKKHHSKLQSFSNKSLIGLKIIFQDLKKRWLATLFIIVTFFIILFSLITGLEMKFGLPLVNSSNFLSNADTLTIRKSDGTEFTEEEENKFNNITEITKNLDKYNPKNMLDVQFIYGDKKYYIYHNNDTEWVDTSNFFNNRFSRMDLEGEFIKNDDEIIISKKAVKELGIDDPIGKTIEIGYRMYVSRPVFNSDDNKIHYNLKQLSRVIINPLKIVGINNSKKINNADFSIVPLSVLKTAAKLRSKNPIWYLSTKIDQDNNYLYFTSGFEDLSIAEQSPNEIKMSRGRKPLGKNEIIISNSKANEFIKSITDANPKKIINPLTYEDLLKLNINLGFANGEFRVKVVGIFENTNDIIITIKENIDRFNGSFNNEKKLYINYPQNVEHVKNKISKEFNNELEIIDPAENIRSSVLGANRESYVLFGIRWSIIGVLTFILIFIIARIFAVRKNQEVKLTCLLGASRKQTLFYQMGYIFSVMLIILISLMALYYPVYLLLGTFMDVAYYIIPSVGSLFSWIFITWSIVFIAIITIFITINMYTHYRYKLGNKI